MKKIAAVLVGVVCAVLLVWQCRGRSTSRPSTSTTDRATAGTQHGSHAQGDRPLPAWFAVRNAPARKIAGRVTLNGKPVAGADVSLQSVLTRAGFGVPVLLHTGADGAFDFGMRPAAQYEVTASTSATIAAIAHVDLTDPTLKPPSDQLELRLH
ncbi:MAG TPA: carboxypeptidase-like regulatory domain-containing protein, partial [Kofleriaceae bacterium]|nr:carboxypeptidase-like regulatory domain-containing protein [Kofleriaceae bacterium]